MGELIESTGENEMEILFRKELKVLNETEETKKESLWLLRKLIDDEKDLYCRTDDPFLVRFLRTKKYDVPKTFELLKNYYKERHKNRSFHEGTLPSLLTDYLKERQITVLPHRDQLGRRIVCLNFENWDPKTFSLELFMQCYISIMEEIIEEEETQVFGIVTVANLNMSLYQTLHMYHPYALKRGISFMQNSFPARVKAFHLINNPPYFEFVWKFVRAFLKEKIKNRIHFYGRDPRSLHEFVSPSILPEEFGGKRPPIDNAEFVEQFLKSEEKRVNYLRYGYGKK